MLNRITGQRAVNVVVMDELAAVLDEFVWTPDAAIASRNTASAASCTGKPSGTASSPMSRSISAP
ncbi:MAG: hypothetical protein OXP75_05360 [Rhodospirillales bacterium]|nr:hypothetical protein [Rhodospirillales bacterium]